MSNSIQNLQAHTSTNRSYYDVSTVIQSIEEYPHLHLSLLTQFSDHYKRNNQAQEHKTTKRG